MIDGTFMLLFITNMGWPYLVKELFLSKSCLILSKTVQRKRNEVEKRHVHKRVKKERIPFLAVGGIAHG